MIFVASTGRRVVSATMSLVEAPQRQTKTRCSMFANFGCRSDRTNDVGRPQASQLGFLGVCVRMGPTRQRAIVRFVPMELKSLNEPCYGLIWRSIDQGLWWPLLKEAGIKAQQPAPALAIGAVHPHTIGGCVSLPGAGCV